MIKACLSYLPVYSMSSFKLPTAVEARLDQLRRNFLWEGQSDRRKIHPLKWSEVIKPMRFGGAVLRRIEE